MLCKCHWIVLYTVHFIAFSLRRPFFSRHGVYHMKHADLFLMFFGVMLLMSGLPA